MDVTNQNGPRLVTSAITLLLLVNTGLVVLTRVTSTHIVCDCLSGQSRTDSRMWRIF